MSGSAPAGELGSLVSTAPAVWLTCVASLIAARAPRLDKTAAILVRSGAALRPPGGRARRRARRRPARRPDAPADARGVRRTGAPARRGLGAADFAGVRPSAFDGPLRAAGHGQDDARAACGGARRGGLRGALGGQRRARRGAGGDRAGRRAETVPTRPARAADDLLPRR